MAEKLGVLNKLYYKLPVCLQNLMCSVKGYLVCRRRYNKSFYKYLELYEGGKVNAILELRRFLQEAEKSEFYKDLFESTKFNIEAENIYDELRKLPVLLKSDVVKNHRKILNTHYVGKTIDVGTSGTTGAGLFFPMAVDAEIKQWAVWWRYRRNLGIGLDTWCGWFGGKIVVPARQQKSPYWRINFSAKQVMFSYLHLTKDTVGKYYKEIKKRKLPWLHGYACNIYLLASLIKDKGLQPLECVRFVTTGSDNLLDSYRILIKQVFPNAQVHQHYGLGESVANFSEDRNGVIRVDDDFAYVEFIPLDEEEPELCRIIGTGFCNSAFPLIRYDTGDIARIRYDDQGRIQILGIDGRSTEYVKLPGGRRIGVTGLDNFEYLTKIEAAQYIQEDLYSLTVKVVKGKGYDEQEEKGLLNEIYSRIPKEVKVKIEYVDKLERTKSGKIRLIISEV